MRRPCFALPSPLLSLHASNYVKLSRHALRSRPATHLSRECKERSAGGRGPPAVVMRVVRFRPCIDIHSGRVKQIVGSTLVDERGQSPTTNFETDTAPSYFASLYARDALPGGHVIMLGPGNEHAAEEALSAYPGGLHVGGGITPDNASRYLDAGASHVIVTSYVFRDGVIDWDRVDAMKDAVGQSRLVLDVSCRRRAHDWVVCTDRWQKWTDMVLGPETLGRLGDHCDELLVHAVDVEGKRSGMDEELVARLADWTRVPITYAGGVRSIKDLERAKDLGRGFVDVTIGSALDIFGGELSYDDAVRWQRAEEAAAVGTMQSS